MAVNRITYRPVMGGRSGSAVADFEKLCELFGNPEMFGKYRDYDKNKVTVAWTFSTPRGPVEIRDYWWNASGEWSIAAQSRKAAMWLCRKLRKMGVPASTRFHYGRDAKPFKTCTTA